MTVNRATLAASSCSPPSSRSWWRVCRPWVHELASHTTGRRPFSVAANSEVAVRTAIAAACADDVVVPFDAGCCAFAGDRGLLHPELTASATAREAAEVRRGDYDAYLSSNRTCELGMSRATGHSYRHAIELLEELSRPL